MKTKFNFRKWLRSRNGAISIIGALLALIIVAVVFGGDLLGLTGTAGVPAELPEGANCLPTCDVTDGRMFTIASDGTANSGWTVDLYQNCCTRIGGII